MDTPPDSTSPETFRTLPTKMTHSGMELKQIKREGDFAIYSKGKEGKIYGYEVVRIRKSPGGEMFGKMIPPGELYPGNEQFGTYGWYFNDLPSADTRFQRLIQKFKEADSQTVTDGLVTELEATKLVGRLIE